MRYITMTYRENIQGFKAKLCVSYIPDTEEITNKGFGL